MFGVHVHTNENAPEEWYCKMQGSQNFQGLCPGPTRERQHIPQKVMTDIANFGNE